MDSGTPKDALERCTEASNKTNQNNNNNDTDDTSPHHDVQEMIHQWNLLSDKFDPESETRFRDNDGVFKMETAVTRKLGKGLKLFATPKINTRHKAIYSTPCVYIAHNNESEAILVDDVILTKIEEMKSTGLYDILSLRNLSVQDLEMMVNVRWIGTYTTVSVPLSSIELSDTWHKTTVNQVYNNNISDLTYDELCILHATKKFVRTVNVNGKQIQCMEPNGTLENIKTYAKLAFNNDVDQEVAFIHIVSAFVVKLFDKVVNNGNTRKRYRNS